MEKLASIVPYKNTTLSKKTQVKIMFDKIAKTYDLLNHIFSMGIDRRWRKKLIYSISPYSHDKILDLATGTGDLIFYLIKLKPDEIVGIDISEKMLELGREKINKKLTEHSDKISLQVADSEKMDFADESFNVVTCAFGIRNSENLTSWVKEVYRVLSSGGIFAILEFSHIKNPVISAGFNFYFNKILPFVGRIITKDPAYYYLPESVKNFPYGDKFTNFVEMYGFKTLKVKPLSFGIATIYIFQKINKDIKRF